MFTVLSDPAIYEFENTPPVSEAWLRERFSKLESRRSADGMQQWLNWVIRLQSGNLAGYVQATVVQSGTSFIAYELASKYWRRGIGRSAVLAILHELASHHGVNTFVAVLKEHNFRSLALLRQLGFAQSSPEQTIAFRADRDELVMVKVASPVENVA
jgi:RimJ/RimL family protein N-acetyltransferase